MPTDSQDTPRSLPEQPNLRHLKAQAKDLLKAGEATSLTDGVRIAVSGRGGENREAAA